MTAPSYGKKDKPSKALEDNLKHLRVHLFVSEPILRFLNADFGFATTRLEGRKIACDPEELLTEIVKLPREKITGVKRMSAVPVQARGPLADLTGKETQERPSFELLRVYDANAPVSSTLAAKPGSPLFNETRAFIGIVADPLESGPPTLDPMRELQKRLAETLIELIGAPDGASLPHLHEAIEKMTQRPRKPGVAVSIRLRVTNGVPRLDAGSFQPMGLDTDLWVLLLDFVANPGWSKILKRCPGCGCFHTRRVSRKGYVASRTYCSDTCAGTMRKRRLRAKVQPHNI
jgi:hypothetical protein